MSSVPVAGILGWPVAHSRSPVIHHYWLRHHGLAGRYERWAVQDIRAALMALKEKGWVGANITRPHKEEAFAFLSEEHQVSAQAARVGAVNTVVVAKNFLRGDNTDVAGFEAHLRAGAPHYDRGLAVILGAGGAARAVAVALQDRGAAVHIVARRPEQAQELLEALGLEGAVFPWDEGHKALDGAALVVNTTPPTTSSPVSLKTLAPGGVVADLAYVPLKTPLLRLAQKKGFECLDGLGMLLYQAVGGFEAWFGVRPQVSAALEAYVRGDLERGGC